MTDLEKQFNREMRDVYISAKRECGYNATRFLQMLSDQGGVKTAKQLIQRKIRRKKPRLFTRRAV